MARATSFSARLLLTALAVLVAAFGQNSSGTSAFRPGQTLLYSLRLHETRKVKPESQTSLSASKSAVIDSQALLKVEVLSVNGSSVKIRTSFGAFSSDTHFRVPNTGDISPEQHRRGMDPRVSVQATFRPGGVVSDVEGLDALFPEQRQVWWNWAVVFGLALDAPPPTKKGGQVSLTEVPMSLGDSPELKWTRELQLAGHENCNSYSLGVSREPAKSAAVAGGCTKMIVRSELAQAALQSDVTKGLYLQRHLKRSGAVHGRGETRAQVSKDAGSLVRSDSNFEERSDVYFIKADHSDSVAYKSSTKTHAEIHLLTDSLLAQRSTADRP